MSSNKKLSATITIGGAISGTLKAAFGEVKGKLGEIGTTVTNLTKRQKLLGKTIQEFGRAGKNVDGLRNSYIKLSAQIDRARHAQERMTKAMAFKERAGKIGGHLKSGAMYAGAGAGSLALLGRPAVHAAIERENAVALIRNSGVSKEEGDAMVKAAEGARQFGVSTTEATKTVSELRTVLGNTHEALAALPTSLKVISGLRLYDRLHHSNTGEGDSAYNIAKFAEERGGGSSPELMQLKQNWAFKLLTGTGGKVTAADILLAQRNGKSATAGMTDASFAHDAALMVAMGSSKYATASSTAYQSLIGMHAQDTSKAALAHAGLMTGVSFNKLGSVDAKKSKASRLVDQDLYIRNPQAWVEKHLVPLAQKAGVQFDASGNSVDPAAVSSFIAGFHLNSNTSNILENRLRLRGNVAKDARNVDMAHGINESDAQNKRSTAGKEENVYARLDDVETRIGKVLLPAFATAMEKVASVLERVNKFAEDNPVLFKRIVIGVAELAAGLAVAVPVLLVANGVLQTIAFIKLARATAEVTSMVSSLGGVQGAAASAGSGILGLVGKIGAAVGLVGLALAAAKAMGLPDADKKKGIEDIKKGNFWGASFDLPATDFVHAGMRWAAGDSNDEIAAKLGGKSAPAVPPMASKAPVTNNSTVNMGGITINQQPGQDGYVMSKQLFDEMQRRQGVKDRSTMFDGASQ